MSSTRFRQPYFYVPNAKTSNTPLPDSQPTKDDEIRELRIELQSSQAKVDELQQRVEELESEAQEHTPAFIIGKDVRLRYLENYRKRTLGPSVR